MRVALQSRRAAPPIHRYPFVDLDRDDDPGFGVGHFAAQSRGRRMILVAVATRIRNWI